MIKDEYNVLKNMMKNIENRMYCEYFQIHCMIQDFVTSDIPSDMIKGKLIIKKYPPYKKLQPTKDYGFDIVNEIRQNIINAISELISYQSVLDEELTSEIRQSELGINIENLVNSTRFSNIVLKERIALFTNYLLVFNRQHTKYMNRLLIKSRIVLGMMNEDIKLKQSEEVIDMSSTPLTYENVNIQFYIKDD